MIRWAALCAGLAAGCSAIVGIEDEPPAASQGDAGASGSLPAPSDAGDAGEATPADAADSDALDPEASDLDWAAWPVPPDAPTSLVLEGDVVSDSVTGLSWHAAASPSLMLADVTPYCEESTVGGFDDWRAPRWIELISITDYSRRDPALNPAHFTAPVGGFVLSVSRSYVAETVIGVAAHDGRVTFADVALLHTTRCVRGAGRAGTAPANRYEIETDVVRDRFTSLEWQRDPSAARMLLADARASCTALALAGGGWRMPSIKELLTLLDTTTMAPTRWYVPAFGRTVMRETWSNTMAVTGTDEYWTVDFGTAGASTSREGLANGVRCVR